ncbi:MAG TPA: Arm DNA-binding domain-containing protein, partial [Chitinophagaceae bacterium]|nr:Arm DNA-binding domain-containing protein [Chitinophagaceae bacterium]
MPTLNVILKKHYQKKDGTYPVVFQLIIKERPKYFYSGYSVKSNQFKPGLSGWIIKHPDAELINRNLEMKRSSVMGNLLDAQAGKFPMDHKAIFTGSSNAGLTIDGIIAERATIYEDRGSTWYMQLSTVRDEIRAFWGPNKAVSAISVQMAHEYQNYLREKGNGPNTIAKKIKTLRGLVSQKIAAGEYQGLNPFALVKTSSVPVK